MEQKSESRLSVNCRPGLILFGAMEVALGLLILGMTSLILLMSLMGRSADGFRTFIVGGAVYAAIGVVLITLGVGSIRCRRWARTLSLIVSGYGLLGGFKGLAVISFYFSKTGENTLAALPHGVYLFAVIFGACVFGFFGLLLPSAGLAFYSNQHVRATCEMRDLRRGWTDGCPLPVLALCLGQVAAAAACLLTTLTHQGVTFYFGLLLSGAQGVLACLCVVLVWLYAARGLMRCGRAPGGSPC